MNHCLTDGTSPKVPARGDLVFEDVSFMYSDGKSDVLKNVSFHAKPGQAIALLGSTGSGKTSLVNLLPRFHEYTGGQSPAGRRGVEGLFARVLATADRHCGAGAVFVQPLDP